MPNEIRIRVKTTKDKKLIEEVESIQESMELPSTSSAARYLIRMGIEWHRRKPKGEKTQGKANE